METILIKNGKISGENRIFEKDILIKNGKIFAIENNIPESFEYKIIDAKNKLVIPGAIDPHVHLDLPTNAGNSSDNFYTGSVAAFFGGTTTIIDFVTPEKGESLINALHKRKGIANDVLCDYSLHMGITYWHSSLEKEIKQCIENEGITSFKAYLAYKGTIGIDYDELFELMKVISKYNGTLLVHCEDGDKVLMNQQKLISEGKTMPKYHSMSRLPEIEAIAVEKVIKMAAITNCNVYLVHISSAEAMKIIADYNLPNVLVETCPQYLILYDDLYQSDNFADTAKYIISPPLRKKKDNDALWRYLSENKIDVVSTDHCPFNIIGQKDSGINDFTKIPNGAGGIEHRLELLYEYGVLKERINLQQWINFCFSNPSEIFGFNNKGKIKKGYDADIVIWNSSLSNVISVSNQHQRCDNNIYEGIKISGQAETVIKKGKIVIENRKLSQNLQKGSFIPTFCFNRKTSM
jgi:dihydropyrimidinase